VSRHDEKGTPPADVKGKNQGYLFKRGKRKPRVARRFRFGKRGTERTSSTSAAPYGKKKTNLYSRNERGGKERGSYLYLVRERPSSREGSFLLNLSEKREANHSS